MRTKISCLALILATAAPLAARAESGFLNLHLEPGLSIPAAGFIKDAYEPDRTVIGFHGAIGVDIQPFSPIGFQVRYGFGLFPHPVEDSDETGYTDHSITAGVRWRVIDNREGYQFSGGDILGNGWVDANIGYHHFYDAGALGLDLGVGYEWSIIEPLQIGLFARGYYVFEMAQDTDNPVTLPNGQDPDESEGSLYLVGGLSFSLALLGEPDALDTDGDGLSDEREVQSTNTDPQNPDSDGDLLSDGVEVTSGRTEARNPDSDGDGLQDGAEDANRDGSTDSTETDPTNPDTDGGGVPDGWEVEHAKNALQPADDDSDGDGVKEHVDQCQGTPQGTEVDQRGCAILRAQIVLRGVNFAFNSAEIEPTSFRVLDQVARVLADNPDVRIEISGHTDNVGGRAYNERLSHARAESVLNYMVSKGIPRARLQARGMGMSRPVASNDTEEGRAQNRRIEFNRLDQEAAPH